RPHPAPARRRRGGPATRRPAADVHRRRSRGAHRRRRVLRGGPAGRLPHPHARGSGVRTGVAAPARPGDPEPPARAAPGRRERRPHPVAAVNRYPRPTNGMFVAMTVIVSTFAESGSPARYTTAWATASTGIRGSGRLLPSACGTPDAIRSVIGVA